MPQTVVPQTDFIAIPNTTTETIQLTPPIQGLVAGGGGANAATVTTIVSGINAAIAADAAANAPVVGATTPAPPPDNFRFSDLSVNVTSTTPGDVFRGATQDPAVKTQFIDLTPDALQINALTPNAFIQSGTGNDILSAAGGTNILDAGAGINTMIGAAGHDTFITDTTAGLAFGSLLNFGSGDDAVLFGVDATNFSFTLTNSLFGLEIDANPNAGVVGKNAGELLLQGYSTADIGGKLTLGIGTTSDGKSSFLFAHAT